MPSAQWRAATCGCPGQTPLKFRDWKHPPNPLIHSCLLVIFVGLDPHLHIQRTDLVDARGHPARSGSYSQCPIKTQALGVGSLWTLSSYKPQNENCQATDGKSDITVGPIVPLVRRPILSQSGDCNVVIGSFASRSFVCVELTIHVAKVSPSTGCPCRTSCLRNAQNNTCILQYNIKV